MPTYRKKHNPICLAAQKKHIGIYPGGEATEILSMVAAKKTTMTKKTTVKKTTTKKTAK